MKQRLCTILRVAVSAALIGLVIRALDWRAVVPILAATRTPLALTASTLTGILLLLLALRWRLFLRRQNLQAPFGTVLGLTWAGQFFNSVLPGSIGGDGVKIFELCRRHPAQKLVAASTIILDRLSALLALALLALPAVLLDPLPLRALGSPKIPPIFILLAGAVLLAAALLLPRGLRAFARAGKLAPVVSVLRSSHLSAATGAVAVALSVGIHLLNFTIVFLFARALGLPITYPQILLMLPVVLTLLLLPITINGHGLREVLLIAYFTHFGIHPPADLGGSFREAALALSLLLVANDLLWGLPGGLLYLLRSRGSAHRHPTVEKVCRATSPA